MPDNVLAGIIFAPEAPLTDVINERIGFLEKEISIILQVFTGLPKGDEQ